MRGWVVIPILGVLACASPEPIRPPAAVAPWLRADPQRCLIPRDLREGMEEMARRCAACARAWSSFAFVARYGSVASAR